MTEIYIHRHKEICLEKNTLCFSTKKLHEGSLTGSSTLDEMLTALSDSTLIISPAHVKLSPSDENNIFERKRNSNFFVLRIPPSSKDAQDTSVNNSVSFLQKLASLSFSKSNPEIIHHSSLIEKEMISFAARAIKYQIMEHQKNLEVLPSVLSPPQHSQQERSIFSPLRYISKATAIVHNILGSYPDDHLIAKYSSSDFDEGVDDAILQMDQHDLDDHCDDACTSIKPKSNTFHTIDKNILSNFDVMWNIDLIIDCWRLILKYAQKQIKSKMEGGDDENQLTTICDCDKKQTGLFLYRDGNDRNSFSNFCRECSAYFAQKGDVHSQSILKTVKSGMSMDIMIALLLETKKAFETQDRDIIVLVPSMNLGTDSISNDSLVNEAELCIFKLGTTIHSIEVRIQRLGKQAENARLKALEAKHTGSSKQAVLYMKRRQEYLREVERSSTLLLNLDSGLISLKRAMSDKEVIRSYELMNNTMKSIRQDFDASHVEDVMIEYEDLNDQLNIIHTDINFGSQSHQDVESDELLLKELDSLMINEIQKTNIDETRDVSSGTLGDKKDLSKAAACEDQDQEEKILLPA